MYPGYVVRYVEQTTSGAVVYNVGEGSSPLQSQDSPLTNMINDNWVDQTETIINNIKNRGDASGGFVLY